MSKNKYNVSPPEKRTWNGRTYDSKAECEYAQVLEQLRDLDEVVEFIEQPRLWLGVPENIYRPDFLVIAASGKAYYVDVKGHETRQFKKVKRLWAKYGRLPLAIVKRSGPWTFKVTEEIAPS